MSPSGEARWLRSAECIAFFFLSSPRLGSFYVSCGNAGEENALSENTFLQFSAAPFKNRIFVPQQFLFIIATALLQVVFQAGAAAAAAAWHRAA